MIRGRSIRYRYSRAIMCTVVACVLAAIPMIVPIAHASGAELITVSSETQHVGHHQAGSSTHSASIDAGMTTSTDCDDETSDHDVSPCGTMSCGSSTCHLMLTISLSTDDTPACREEHATAKGVALIAALPPLLDRPPRN